MDLEVLAGKRIWIIAHADPPGIKAASGWRAQLAASTKSVQVVDFRRIEGMKIKDLNDLIKLKPERETIRQIFRNHSCKLSH